MNIHDDLSHSSENMTGSKSQPLHNLWRSDFALSEFKILDVYLSRINLHDPSKRTLQISKKELESILNVTKIPIPELRKRLNHLQTSLVALEEPSDNKFDNIVLFERARCEKENGQYIVTLTCSESAMDYIFNVENLGYLKYKLKVVIAIRSRYSYILFLYLEKNRFKKNRILEIRVDELRSMMGCADDHSYDDFKYFNRLLKNAQKEICENTPCQFTYETIREDRKVSKIRFKLKPLAKVYQNDPKIIEAGNSQKFKRENCQSLDCVEQPDKISSPQLEVNLF